LRQSATSTARRTTACSAAHLRNHWTNGCDGRCKSDRGSDPANESDPLCHSV